MRDWGRAAEIAGKSERREFTGPGQAHIWLSAGRSNQQGSGQQGDRNQQVIAISMGIVTAGNRNPQSNRNQQGDRGQQRNGSRQIRQPTSNPAKNGKWPGAKTRPEGRSTTGSINDRSAGQAQRDRHRHRANSSTNTTVSTRSPQQRIPLQQSNSQGSAVSAAKPPMNLVSNKSVSRTPTTKVMSAQPQ